MVAPPEPPAPGPPAPVTPRSGPPAPGPPAPVTPRSGPPAPRPPARPGVPGPRTLRTARAIVLLAVAEILGKLGTLVVVVGAARLLSLTDFGVFSVALGVGALAAVAPSWGLDNVLVQQGARDRAALPTLLAELLVLRSVVSAAMLGLGAVGAVLAGVPEPRLLAVVCVVAAWLVDTLSDAYRSVAIACESQAIVARVQLVQRAATAVLAFGALLIWHNLVTLCVAYLVGTAVGAVGMAAGVRRLGVRASWQPGGWNSGGWLGIRRMCRMSWSIGVHSVASIALFRSDAVLLAVLAGAGAVARYSAAYRLLETVVFVSWTVARAVFPVMASSAEGWRVRRGAERGMVVLAAVFGPYAVVLWCRGEDILRLLFGPVLANGSFWTLAWLAPAPLLFGAAFLAAYVLLADGPTTKVLLGSIGALVVNVGMNLALIPHYGPAAAAAATSVSYAAEIALLYPAARRRAGRPALFRPLLPAAIASALVAAVLLAPLPLPLIPVLLVAAAGYALVWTVLASKLDAEQVGVMRGLLRAGSKAGAHRKAGRGRKADDA